MLQAFCFAHFNAISAQVAIIMLYSNKCAKELI